MFADAFAPKLNLQKSSRLPAISGAARISAAELACLLACGAMAALAIGLLHLSLRMPGHAILRGVLPMAMGLALVPRRSAGTVMAIGAGVTATAMSAGQIGSFPPTAMLSVLALGPVLDLALLGRSSGWRLYARFVIAGAVANLLAFALESRRRATRHRNGRRWAVHAAFGLPIMPGVVHSLRCTRRSHWCCRLVPHSSR